MSLETALTTLKSVADPTRLRLLGVLRCGEATVGELQVILGQSQPRVSRHLRLLGEAGLVSKFRDGQSTYFRLSEDAKTRALVGLIRDIAGNDPLTASDRDALGEVKRARERSVFAGGRRSALHYGPRPDAATLQELLDEAIGDAGVADALDVGCGGGALLADLGARARHVVGIDTARDMRILARSRVHHAGIANCTVRDADMHALPFGDASFDLVLLDEVLGLSEDVDTVLRESARVLRREGCLLILDRIVPVARRLPGEADRVLIENQLTARLRAAGFRAGAPRWLPGRAPEYALVRAFPTVRVAAA